MGSRCDECDERETPLRCTLGCANLINDAMSALLMAGKPADAVALYDSFANDGEPRGLLLETIANARDQASRS